MLARAVAAGLGLVALSACGGELILPEPDRTNTECTTNGQCVFGKLCDLATGRCVDSEGPCAADLPQGHCRPGLQCACDGVCLLDPSACGGGGGAGGGGGWCDCPPAQGCDDGECVDPTVDNSCAPTRPAGVCPGGETCAGGQCVPVTDDNRCSEERPTGFCGPGLSCVLGTCEPITVNPCSTAVPDGNCPDGQRCTGGECVDQPCTADLPGVCPAGQVCGDSGCEPLPCSPLHLDGVCALNELCSLSGACIPVGECVVAEDCDTLPSTYCSLSSGNCLLFGLCAVEEDCSLEEQIDDYGQGYTCDTGACVERDTCTTASDCVPAKFCSSGNRCLGPGFCDDDVDCPTPGEICTLAGAATGTRTCIDTECLVDEDCDVSESCSALGRCLVPGECDAIGDCPPGHACSVNTCVVTGDLCNSNDLVRTGCAADELYCCDVGEDCCPVGQRCSTAGSCIPNGTCVDDGDCLGGAYHCEDFVCVPDAPCDPSLCDGPGEPCPECAVGEYCSGTGGCVPDGNCAGDFLDCPLGEACAATFGCLPTAECGLENLTVASLVQPNVLIILDRSGSMNVCEGSATSSQCCGNAGDSPTCTCADVCSPDACNPDCATPRWEQAVDAINQLTTTYEDQIRFGLSTYPLQCAPPGQTDPIIPCTTPCNWCSCNSFCDINGDGFPDPSQPGQIDVPVAASTQATIASLLATDIFPGGGTPTGQTLRVVLGDLPGAGLAATDRENVVLLITDGEALGDTASITTCAAPCGDSQKNGDETGIDCGGLCPGCATGSPCLRNEDCDSRVCQGGVCRDATCADGAQSGSETAIDCGGACVGCDGGQACTSDGDCASGSCPSTVCDPPSCSDTRQNGGETAVDCGGDCAGCADGQACTAGTDCQNGVCQAGLCRPATCDNGTPDGTETALDCGGGCGPCPDGSACSGGADCESGVCGGTCLRPPCTDGVQNGTETDIDCGGSCTPCPGARTCGDDVDCLSGDCQVCAVGDFGCRVNAALTRLYAVNPSRIKTYVVGFAFDQVSRNLNCHAAHGRTARLDRCPDITPETCAPRLCDNTHAACLTSADCGGGTCLDAQACDNGGAPCLDSSDCGGGTCLEPPACYYDVTDQASLTLAFEEIITDVVTCSYTLSQEPPSAFNIFVYFDDGAALSRVERDFGEVDGWNYDSSTQQIEFFGTACDDVRTGASLPVVLLGPAPGEGGCD